MRVLLAGLVVVLAWPSPSPAAVPVAGSDAAGEPLPKGAKFRLGNGRLVLDPAPFPVRPGQLFLLLPPDYTTFALPTSGGELRRFDAATGKPLREDRKEENPRPPYLVVSSDGKRTVAVATDTLTVRDANTGEVIRELKSPDGFAGTTDPYPVTVAVSADGSVVARGLSSKTVRGEVIVWDVGKNQVAFQTSLPQFGHASPALSADGKKLATRGPTVFSPPPGVGKDEFTNAIQVWDVATKKELFKAETTSPGNPTAPPLMRFSSDGSVLAASFGDGLIDLWEVPPAKPEGAATSKPKTTVLGRTGQGA